MMYDRNRERSLSPSSRDIHTLGHSLARTHSLTKVVLPNPAGAEMRLKGRQASARNRSVKRERGIRSGRVLGICSFVFNNALDICCTNASASRPFIPHCLDILSQELPQKSGCPEVGSRDAVIGKVLPPTIEFTIAGAPYHPASRRSVCKVDLRIWLFSHNVPCWLDVATGFRRSSNQIYDLEPLTL